jgi:hypothetical protein
MGDQLAGSFQSSDCGLANQVALVAKAGSTVAKTPRKIAATENEKIEGRIPDPFVGTRRYPDARPKINPFLSFRFLFAGAPARFSTAADNSPHRFLLANLFSREALSSIHLPRPASKKQSMRSLAVLRPKTF